MGLKPGMQTNNRIIIPFIIDRFYSRHSISYTPILPVLLAISDQSWSAHRSRGGWCSWEKDA